ncbi:MAG: hypothetical protein JJU07_14205 [Natronohydrobacter sp.]|nr:hypothetical protein [Natronohydrobacter sp.]
MTRNKKRKCPRSRHIPASRDGLSHPDPISVFATIMPFLANPPRLE